MKRVNELEGETEIWLENGRKINGNAWTHYVNNENWPVDAATARLHLRHRHITQKNQPPTETHSVILHLNTKLVNTILVDHSKFYRVHFV